MTNSRPKNLEEFIGHESIKQTINVSLEASIARNDAFPHTLIYGGPGLGKSTIAQIIASMRGGEFRAYLSNVFKNNVDVQNLFARLNADNHEDMEDGYEGESFGAGDSQFKIIGPIKPTVIFLDEIHQLNKSTQEAFYQAMDDNILTIEVRDKLNNNKNGRTFWVPKFTLIGATTRAGELDKPFIDRFKLHLTLNSYSERELCFIVSNYAEKIDIKISDEAIEAIAQRARGIARRAINFVERSKDMAIFLNEKNITKSVVEQTFTMHKIDQIGLEEIDRLVLAFLYRAYPSKIGVNRLSGVLNISDKMLKEIIEPYLLRQGFIEATPSGRIITEAGLVYCEKNNLIPRTPGKIIGATRKVPVNV